ncbi:hypothetical protein ACHAXH_002741 [Discostella pseudostelligera]
MITRGGSSGRIVIICANHVVLRATCPLVISAGEEVVGRRSQTIMSLSRLCWSARIFHLYHRRPPTSCPSLPSHRIQNISTSAAKSMLGFSDDQQFTIRELRHAYFEAAKRYHPDVLRQRLDGDGNNNDDNNVTIDFRDITDAYEHLLNCPDQHHAHPHPHQHHYTNEEMDNLITISEDEEYRQACQSQLGLPAEIVEESKQNPMFRKWLMGNTDAAHIWRVFLASNGGLAQKLRPIAGYLGKGGANAELKKSETRRQRSKR